MPIYEFVNIDRVDGPFEVPGEIVEICDHAPHSKSSFTAIIRLDENDVEEDDDVESHIDYQSVDGIGSTVGVRLQAAGFLRASDVREATIDELTEVNGLGPGTAERLKEYVEST